MEKKRNKGSVFFGAALAVTATLCLWHNEGRFDYYKAARQTQVVSSPGEATGDRTTSYTGALGPCVVEGNYVTAFTDYYQVRRSAQIYSWDRNEDSDGDVTWRKGWYSRLDDNSRNSGFKQVLTSEKLGAKEYRIENMEIASEKLRFVDDSVRIDSSGLKLTKTGKSLGLKGEGEFFYLRQSSRSKAQIGDERLIYKGIPTADTATYFGMISDEKAVGKQVEKKSGLIASLIQDDGILHHVVNGPREEALSTVKSHQRALKWKVRLFGTAGVIIGLAIFLSRLLHLLVSIPLFGRLVNGGILLVSVILGGAVSLLTIGTSLLFHKPGYAIVAVILLIGIIGYFVMASRKSAAGARRRLGRHNLGGPDSTGASQAAPSAIDGERTRATFGNMVKLALADGDYDDKENEYLVGWGRTAGLPDVVIEKLFEKARTEADSGLQPTDASDLEILVALALADGHLSARELHKLVGFGEKLGMSRDQVNAVISGMGR